VRRVTGGVHGLPPPPWFIYLSRLINPYRCRTCAGSPMTKGRWHGSSVRDVYIFDPALEESAITERLERFHALPTKDSKGSLTNVANPCLSLCLASRRKPQGLRRFVREPLDPW